MAEIIPPGVSLTPCILDDDREQLDQLTAMLHEMGYAPIPTRDPEEALTLVEYGRCKLVLATVHMPAMDAYAFLERALRSDPGVHVVLLAREYTLQTALEAIRRGASDFMPKPLDRSHLKKTLDDISALYDQRRRVKELEEQLLDVVEFHGIIGKSPLMLGVFDSARKIARHYTNVLLVGPTGSGKELVANAIHQISPIGDQKFVVCNCSTMVDTLLESQLFGHVRGAFTGAIDSRKGLFEYADGGTIFLDEVGDTSLAMQAKLLRVIQNREFQRVGSPEVRHISVRIIAATNRDLRADVLAGHFREDLFYRLSPIQIRIPSLSQRLEDLPLLIQFFVNKCNGQYGKNIAGLTKRARKVLQRHPWHGNVRELENVIISASIIASGEFIDFEDLPESLQQPKHHSGQGGGWEPLLLDDVRELHIRRVLELCQGNRARAAQVLGIGKTTMYRYIKQFGSAPGACERSAGAVA
jgi:DNA-binding NtrC family response regulator